MSDQNTGGHGGRIEVYRCADCGSVMATFTVVCHSCMSARIEKAALGGSGRVQTFTILSVPSEAFADEAPYAYVIVRLHEGCTVSGWMRGVGSPAELAIGDEVEYSGMRGQASVFKKKVSGG